MNSNSKTYRSNGKLLITSEYLVLDGATALAIPTKYGQSLTVTPHTKNTISWKSYNELNSIWFEDTFVLVDGAIQQKTKNQNPVSNRLIEILDAAKQLNLDFLNSNTGFAIETHQDFNRLWGLGTSSTLINNIANWASVNAYTLLNKTFGGSGYDIACAQHTSPITYTLDSPKTPKVNIVNFNPTFKAHLYFVYLNQKKNSRDGIANYRANATQTTKTIEAANTITNAIINSKTLKTFNELLIEHEDLISKCTNQPTIKSLFFKDFNGAIKSLGAWGGDFVLVASETNPEAYFKSKGFNIIIPYKIMVL